MSCRFVDGRYSQDRCRFDGSREVIQPQDLAVRPFQGAASQPLAAEQCRLLVDGDPARRGQFLRFPHPPERRAGEEPLAPHLVADAYADQLAAADADGDAEGKAPQRGFDLAHLLAQSLLDLERGSDGGFGVVLTGEEDQPGIAAELLQIAAVTFGNGDQHLEEAVDDVGNLFCARVGIVL